MSLPAAGGASWQRLLLPNRAQLILAPMRDRQSVSVALMLRVGSRWEPLRSAGVSHFLEHIVFKGTERFPTSRAISESVEGVGGVLNAGTEKEMTSFWAKVPSEYLELATNVLWELAFHPRIEPEEVDRERQVVLEELLMYLDQPGELAQLIFDACMWGGHPLARDPAGTKASLKRLDAEQLRGYRETFYTPDRLVVVVTGGFDPGAAERMLLPRMESLPPAASGAPYRRDDGGKPGAIPEGSPMTRTRRRRGEQVHLNLGVRCPSYLDPDRWKLDILNTVLGDGMSSRLFLELRERQGLAYEVSSYTARHADSGAFCIYLATQPPQLVRAAREALLEVRKMAEQRLGAEELARAKQQISGRLRLQLEGTSALAEFLGQQASLTGEIMSVSEIVEQVNAVDAVQLQELAQQLFVRGGWRAAAVGPVADPGELSRAVIDAVAA